jgi:hypothetical protein
MGMAL